MGYKNFYEKRHNKSYYYSNVCLSNNRLSIRGNKFNVGRYCHQIIKFTP